MIKVTIDGKELKASPEQTVLEVARQNEIYIPALCYHERLNPIKSCRICLVEVEGAEMPMAACATPVTDGMVVHTKSERVKRMRLESLKLLLVNHPLDCPVCDAGGECLLQNLVYEFGIQRNEYPAEPVDRGTFEYGTPLIRQWPDRCVMCLRCVRACTEITGADVLEVTERGFSSRVTAVRKENCISCGECLNVCPVGALTENLSPIKGRTWQLMRTVTTCTYCACGCQLELNTLGREKVVRVSTKGGSGLGVNRGSLCVRGRFGYDYIHHQDRLKKPLLRKGGVLTEVGWDEAIDFVARRLEDIKAKYGPHTIGGICSPRATNEENYLFQKWMRVCIGSNHIDSGARLSGGSTLYGMLESIGYPGMTHEMDDISHADLILLLGADVYDDQLIFSHKMRDAFWKKSSKIIVADPRKTKWEEWADLWLSPTPGTDLVWINGLIREIIERGGFSKIFIESKTVGFEDLKASLNQYTPDRVEQITGIPASQLKRVAEMYLDAPKRAIVFGSGVTQHIQGTKTVKALCNLALLTAEIEEGGGGLYPLLQQSNAQGSWDMGCLPDLLPGYLRVEDEAARKRFSEAWGNEIPAISGFSYPEMFDRIFDGKIRALVVFGDDPFLTLPNLERLRLGINRLELLVVEDIFLSNVGRHAHVILPGVTFAEKDGTFTNMERRIQRVRQAISPVGEAMPEWRILCELSSKMGYSMDYEGPAAIMEEISSLVPAYRSVRFGDLGRKGFRWSPANGRKYKFAVTEFEELTERPDSQYPFWIVAGGYHYNYAIGTDTPRTQGLSRIFGEPHLEVNPEDAKEAGLSQGQWIKLVSHRGSIETTCRISETVPKGVAYYANTFARVPINDLIPWGWDPVSHSPQYKAFAGKIEKI